MAEENSRLLEKFWSFAYMWGYFTHNRIVNSLTGDKTPLELMFGKTPLFDQLHTFGEVAFVHKPHHLQGKKTGKRAWRCNFVGQSASVNTAAAYRNYHCT
ncbi:uncharacterized protein VP01_10740g1 [Puccinia sorghi]|uniref:Uncharacterized protein n=1 Tax=Puccinia sorghi TaxID=27349 RepID=A0A0L6VTV2_9BASI|nr:uncharacterized protein VP01_10740g1 [Puccinia sorghi]